MAILKKRRRKPGGGRKPRVPGDPTVKLAVTVRQSIAAALDALGGSRSEHVDALLAEALAARERKAQRAKHGGPHVH